MAAHSRIFSSAVYHEIERATVDSLNAREDFHALASEHTEPREVGESVQRMLGKSFKEVLGDHAVEYASSSGRRAFADISFTDAEDRRYAVDVKTHRLGSTFSMPNLTSVDRLADWYEDDRNYFVLLLVDYRVTNGHFVVDAAKFTPIEWLSWSCLTIGALGCGQVQLRKSSNVVVIPRQSRKRWMLDLCDALGAFYRAEITKITAERIPRFEAVRAAWGARMERDDE